MLRSILSCFLLAFALECPAANYSDWWWNPSQSGHGLNIGHQGNILFLSWFTYDETGNGMWLVMAGPLAGNVVQGDFIRTTGPRLGDAFDPARVTGGTVGTGKVTFSSLHNATFDWTVNGKSGSVPLVRQSWAQSDPSGFYVGGDATAAVPAGCPFAGGAAKATDATFTVSVANNVFSMSWITHAGNQFDFTAPITNSGQWLQLTGTYRSTNIFGTGRFTASVLVVDNSIIFQDVMYPDAYPDCPGAQGTLTGGRQP